MNEMTKTPMMIPKKSESWYATNATNALQKVNILTVAARRARCSCPRL
jgi:hypothetical protein